MNFHGADCRRWIIVDAICIEDWRRKRWFRYPFLREAIKCFVNIKLIFSPFAKEIVIDAKRDEKLKISCRRVWLQKLKPKASATIRQNKCNFQFCHELLTRLFTKEPKKVWKKNLWKCKQHLQSFIHYSYTWRDW